MTLMEINVHLLVIGCLCFFYINVYDLFYDSENRRRFATFNPGGGVSRVLGILFLIFSLLILYASLFLWQLWCIGDPIIHEVKMLNSFIIPSLMIFVTFFRLVVYFVFDKKLEKDLAELEDMKKTIAIRRKELLKSCK